MLKLWRIARGGADNALSVAEAGYRAASAARRFRFVEGAETLAGCKVVSVGNLTLGGTGKTPAVQWLARWLTGQGQRVCIVARGYGGSLSRDGAIVSNGDDILLDAAQSGDEPLLHARALPGVGVVIGRDRVQAVKRARDELGAQVVLLDDGFQFWSLARDFDLVLLDARRPFDNGHLLPRGRLREPPSELARADAILLTRASLADVGTRARARQQIARYTSVPVFEAGHAPVGLRDERSGERLPLDALKGADVGALSALADNQAFGAMLGHCGARVVSRVGKRDHHRWREAEVQAAVERAVRAGAKALVTTEKDAVKLQAAWAADLPLWSLLIEMRLSASDAATLQSEVARAIAE